MSANTSADVGAPSRPPVVDYAIYALIARCVFSLGSAFAFYGARDEVTRSLADANKNKHWSAATLHHNVDTWLRGYLISSLVMIVMVAIIAWFIREGRNWARLLYLVFAVLVTRDVFQVLGFLQYHDFLARTLTGLAGLSSLVALVLLFLPDSNAYFRRAGPGGGLLGGMFRPRAAAVARNQPGHQPPVDGQPAEPGLTEPYVAEPRLTGPYVAEPGLTEPYVAEPAVARQGPAEPAQSAPEATSSGSGTAPPDAAGQRPADQAPGAVPAGRRPAPRGKSRQPGKRDVRR